MKRKVELPKVNTGATHQAKDVLTFINSATIIITYYYKKRYKTKQFIKQN